MTSKKRNSSASRTYDYDCEGSSSHGEDHNDHDEVLKNLINKIKERKNSQEHEGDLTTSDIYDLAESLRAGYTYRELAKLLGLYTLDDPDEAVQSALAGDPTSLRFGDILRQLRSNSISEDSERRRRDKLELSELEELSTSDIERLRVLDMRKQHHIPRPYAFRWEYSRIRKNPSLVFSPASFLGAEDEICKIDDTRSAAYIEHNIRAAHSNPVGLNHAFMASVILNLDGRVVMVCSLLCLVFRIYVGDTFDGLASYAFILALLYLGCVLHFDTSVTIDSTPLKTYNNCECPDFKEIIRHTCVSVNCKRNICYNDMTKFFEKYVEYYRLLHYQPLADVFEDVRVILARKDQMLARKQNIIANYDDMADNWDKNKRASMLAAQENKTTRSGPKSNRGTKG